MNSDNGKSSLHRLGLILPGDGTDLGQIVKRDAETLRAKYDADAVLIIATKGDQIQFTVTSMGKHQGLQLLSIMPHVQQRLSGKP